MRTTHFKRIALFVVFVLFISGSSMAQVDELPPVDDVSIDSTIILLAVLIIAAAGGSRYLLKEKS